MTVSERKNFISRLTGTLFFVLLWAVYVGRYAVDHFQRYGMTLYQYDKMVLLFDAVLLLMILFLCGRNWKQENLTDYFKKKPLIVLLFLMLATVLVVYHNYLYANCVLAYTDIGSDTTEQYIPAMQMIVDKLQARDFSMWEFNWGLGIDLANSPSLLFDPFNIPIYAAGVLIGHQAMLYMICLVQIAKILLLGLLVWKYLGNFNMHPYAKVTASYVCAFCGFMLLWGSHYFFASVCVFYMLILVLVEECLRSRKFFLLLIPAVAVTLMFSLYSSYMVALAVAAYLVFRLLTLRNRFSLKKRAGLLGLFIIAVIIAAMISAVLVLPVYYQLTVVSSRLGGEQDTWTMLKQYAVSSYHRDMLKITFLRLFSNNLEGTAENYTGVLNYYEAPQIFFSCMFLPMFGICVSEKIRRNEHRLLTVLAALLIIYAWVSPLTAFVFNKFATTATRYAFVFIPVAAYCIAYVLTKLTALHPVSIGAGIGLSLISIAATVRQIGKAGESLSGYTRIIPILIAVFILSVIGARFLKNEKIRQGFCFTAALFLCVSTISDGMVTVNRPTTWSRDHISAQEDFGILTNAAEDYMEADIGTIVYRSEKAYPEVTAFNDSMLQDYSGISYYNTTYNKYMISFFHTIWPEVLYSPIANGSYVVFYQDPDNAEMNTLLGVRYILAQNDSEAATEYSLVYAVNDDVGVYLNEDAESIGFLYNAYLTEDDFCSEYNDVEARRAAMMQTVVISDPGEAILNLDLEDSFDADADTDTAGTEDAAVSTDTAVSEEAAAAVDAGDSETYNGELENVLVRKTTDSYLTAEVAAESDQILFVSIPYDDGWSALIDGEETEISRGNIGFLAIPVEAGEHEIVLQYHSPYMRTGMWISCIGVIGYLLLVFNRFRKGKVSA